VLTLSRESGDMLWAPACKDCYRTRHGAHARPAPVVRCRSAATFQPAAAPARGGEGRVARDVGDAPRPARGRGAKETGGLVLIRDRPLFPQIPAQAGIHGSSVACSSQVARAVHGPLPSQGSAVPFAASTISTRPQARASAPHPSSRAAPIMWRRNALPVSDKSTARTWIRPYHVISTCSPP